MKFRLKHKCHLAFKCARAKLGKKNAIIKILLKNINKF